MKKGCKLKYNGSYLRTDAYTLSYLSLNNTRKKEKSTFCYKCYFVSLLNLFKMFPVFLLMLVTAVLVHFLFIILKRNEFCLALHVTCSW